MKSREIKQNAREALSGNWFSAVIAGFIATVLGAVSMSGGVSFSFNFTSEKSFEESAGQLNIPEEVLVTIALVLAVVAIVASVYAVIQLIVGSVVSIGYAEFNINIVESEDPSISTLFSNFDRSKTAIWARILRSIKIALWTLLFVIPGIVASYKFALMEFVLADNPEMSAREALKESKELMSGNKWRLFCLQLSFIGWYLLGILTLGIAFIWIVPYQQASYAEFYRDVRDNA